MRAAGAEGGDPRNFCARTLKRCFFVLNKFQTRFDDLAGVELGNALSNHPRDHGWCQFTGCGQQPGLARHFPFTMFVVFTDHARTHIIAPVIELLFHLVFDELAFFFDHQNFIKPHGEFAHAGRFQRPGHTNFHESDADFGSMALINAQIFQRLQDI